MKAIMGTTVRKLQTVVKWMEVGMLNVKTGYKSEGVQVNLIFVLLKLKV